MSSARIEDEIWTDPKLKGLTPGERLLFIWLFSNPYRHFSGIYYLPKEIIPKQTGLSPEEVDGGIDTLIDRGIVRFSNEFDIIFVVNMLARQTGKSTSLSDTQKTGILTHLKTLHNCPLVTEFINKYSEYGLRMNYTPIDTPQNTPIDTQSKSKSKSQSKKAEAAPPPQPPHGGNGDARPLPIFSCPHFEIDQEYFDALLQDFPGLPPENLNREIRKAADWITDNPGKHKRKAKTGHIANPRSFLRRWLEKVETRAGPGPPGCSQPGIAAWLRNQGGEVNEA